jgi:hypothetical protein
MNTKITSNLKPNATAYIPVSRSIFLPPRLPGETFTLASFSGFWPFFDPFFQVFTYKPKNEHEDSFKFETKCIGVSPWKCPVMALHQLPYKTLCISRYRILTTVAIPDFQNLQIVFRPCRVDLQFVAIRVASHNFTNAHI